MKGFLIIVLINYLCVIFSQLLVIPIPGTILALIVLLILLVTKVLKVEKIEVVANFLLANMIIMFLPPTVKIIDHFLLLKGDFFRIILLLVGTTILTLVVTAYVVLGTIKLMELTKKGKKPAESKELK